MTDRIIQEVDQKYQSDLQKKANKQQSISSLLGQLNTTKRQVNRLLGKMNYNNHKPAYVVGQDQQQKANKMSPANKNKKQMIGKYNYYGKRYRFQQKEQQLHIEPVQNQRQCASQVNLHISRKKNSNSHKTQKEQTRTNMAHIDQSLFFDDGQIKIPSQNYYIYFDKPQKIQSKTIANLKPNKKMQNNIKNQTFFDQSLPQKFKPAWFMQKKINSLQKQLKQMKDRQKRRYVNQSTQIRAMRNTYDQPINLKSNVERMVQTLWR